ncbi:MULTISPECIES: TonB-dependent receptor [unclassified Stenotrophomonas]|uniref:TonB-dependent receptor plug domain-containing protein n=1 Tax=unclassified Stenotrophomonas TaxID=196198 RepID=UPI000D169224|nr:MULTISPECIES: TonB-dependent receptor [unclassified Stenotrophomonas]PTA72412.1 TonB-dependent receptor [Stenotrophomonas sp. Nf1]PTA78163.1 TonB-dependent receptor [Stenotrophomonas sp. Nf4]
MINRKSLSKHPLSFALASAVLLAAAAPAVAQNTTSTTTQTAEETAKSRATNLDTVTVTGSRIGRDVFNSVSPVQVITREETTLAGFQSTAGVLQSTAITAGSAQINNAYGGYVTNGGPGANTVGLRGLGPTRTLILMNGRRVAPAGSRGSVGAADLNVLPNAMVDRVEVLKDGASSIYGSDAVAGVINIITRNKVDGVTVEARHTATEGGGGEERRYSVVFGSTGERGHFSGSYEYYNRDELTLGDRDWSSCNTDYRKRAGGQGAWGDGDYIDPLTGKPKCYPITGTGSNGVTINTIGTNVLAGVPAQGATGTTFDRWRPNSSVTSGLVGFEGVGRGSALNNNIRDTFDPRTLNRSMISGAKTHTLFLQGGLDVNALGNAEAYFELLGSRRESEQTGYRQLSLDYLRGSPLIPSNLQASNFGGGVGVRAFIGYGNDKSSQTVDFFKGTAGLRGELSSTWNYDFYLSHARSDADYTQQSFLTDRLRQSLNVVSDGAGGFRCVDPSNGCVAAPALTSAVVAGKLPQAWKDYVFVPVTGNTLYTETTANFSVDGPLFTLPHGDVRAAFGAEWRRAKIDDTPSIHSINNNLYNLTSSTPTRGTDSVREVFGEIEVPVLSGVTAAEELTFNASARWTDYRSYGSDETYKLGGLWTPVKWLSVRASYGTSYRAPALFEQFLGATSGFLSNQIDPCNNWGADPGTPLAANCASEGLSPDHYATQSVAVINGGGAAAGLKAETSKNFTAGIVLQPELPGWFGDISFAADYFNIEVENGVSRAGGANILDLCYNNPSFRAGGGFCRLVDPRNPVNKALTVYDSYVNLAVDKVRGYDFTLRYTRDVGPGTLRANVQVTHFTEQSNKLFADDALQDYNGMLNTPAYTGTLDLVYSWNKWRARYGLEWVDSMDSYDYYNLDPATSVYKFAVPSYFTHSLSAEYTGDKWSVTAGVRNLRNEEPPMISSGAYNRVGNAPLYSGYDYVGRTYFVNVSKSF